MKFTALLSEEEVTFLNTRVYLEHSQIGTDLHVKPTDTHQYLRMDSCHPHHCKISIPYSQVLRLWRICSEEQHLQKWTPELKKHPLKQGYREQQLDNEIHRALAISRQNCLQPRSNQDKSARILLVVTYHPISQNIQSITRRHPSTLHTSERLREALPLLPLIAFHRPKNLMYLLVRATLTTNNQEPPGNRPCGATGCKTCPVMMASDEFTSHTTGLVYKMNFTTSCKSSHIIYLITCRRCGQQYLGETGQPLHGRVNNHRFNITHGRIEESPVAEHFNGDRHAVSDMTIIATDQIYSHDPCICKIWESRWIRTLGFSYPSGMNLRVDSLWDLLDVHRWTRGFNVPSCSTTRLHVSIIPQINNYCIILTINVMYFLMHGALAILRKADLRPKRRREGVLIVYA